MATRLLQNIRKLLLSLLLLLLLSSPTTAAAVAAPLVHFINAPKCLNRTSNGNLRELLLLTCSSLTKIYSQLNFAQHPFDAPLQINNCFSSFALKLPTSGPPSTWVQLAAPLNHFPFSQLLLLFGLSSIAWKMQWKAFRFPLSPCAGKAGAGLLED